MPILQTLPDFIVNSSTTDFQVEPAITTLADGRVVMTWRSFDMGDGLSTCIRARIFNADGTPTGADFIVNSIETAAHSNPAVAMLANGNIVFSWESDDTADTSMGCIRTRIFSDTGTPIASDFVSNTTVTGQQYAPTVTGLTDGRFLLTWDHYGDEDGPGDEIYARLFNADGTPIAADFVANSTVTGIQSAANVSALSAGRFVMTWMSSDAGDGSMGAIRARIFNADGTAAGTDFIVNSTTTSDQTNPAVVVLADGRMVFTWQSYDSDDGDLSCIRARIFSANGVASGADFIVNTTTFGAQSDAAITALADGRFVVAWASTDAGDGSDGCIRARLYNLDGTPAGNDFIINTTAADYQFTPVLTALPNGNFQVAWMSLDTGDGSINTIRSTIFNPNVFNGTPLADTWTGGNLSDTIYGNDGDDMLYGKDGADIIDGGNGNDHLWGGNGADQLIGGADLDFAHYDDADYGNLTLRLDNSALNVGAAAVGDTYIGIEGLVGGAGNDTIIGNASNNYLFGSGGNDSIDGGAGSDAMNGGDGSDTYYVDSFSDSVSETNAVLASGGDDLVNFSGTSGTFTLGTNIERLTLLGTSAINGTGNALNNTIIGNAAANVIDGGAGNDTLNGGDGSDTYFVDNFSDTVTETNAVLATGGDDLVNFSGTTGTYTLGANIERLSLLGLASINGTGNSLNNTIIGNAAANIIDGGAGNDTMNGGDGNDTYFVDSFSDTVTETNAVLATGGDDLVNFSGTTGTYTLGSNVERLTLLGASAVNGTGNALNNTIIGNAAANIIDGGAGADIMDGGDGSDTYYVDSFSDTVSETNAVFASGGNDLVNFSGTSGTFTLGTNIERLTLLGTSAINGTGNTLNNTIIGNAAANIIDGGAGNDTMNGGDGSDTYYVDSFSDVVSETNAVLATGGNDLVYFSGTSGTFTIGANIERLSLLGTSDTNGTGNTLNNTLTGNSGANILSGLAGNDILDGGAGNDTMIGGDGNDIYYADVTTDTITETNATLATGGDDLVYFTSTTGTFTLSVNVERLTLTGTASINGTGNTLNNTIIGNSGENSLNGGGGNDILDGGDGNDQLYGGTGADQHIGGAGLDFARYDDANYGNLVINLANSSLNTGTAAVGDTYVGIEGVVGGAGYDRIFGNASDNYLYGGDFYDDLYGGDGNDYMVGGDSDDWFYGGNGADTMDGGIDSFVDYARYDDANYGNLTIRLDNSALNTGAAAGDVYINIEGIIGGAGNDTIYGNALVNNLYGQGGADTINGLGGSDNVWGGSGSDRFQFTTALNATNNVDRINDFAHGTDDIVLAQSIFFSIGVALDASEFRLGTAAVDANDFIVYNSANGQLFYDANGSGAGGQTLFATVTAGTVLDVNDFVVI